MFFLYNFIAIIYDKKFLTRIIMIMPVKVLSSRMVFF